MLVRLTFDEQEQVTGFWLAHDRDGPTPKGFRRGGYIVGEPMLKLAGYPNLKRTNFSTLSLSVKLVAPGGGPLAKPPGALSIWKQTTDRRAHSSSKGRLVTLSDGTRWQWVEKSPRGSQSEYTFESLSPGKYRAIASFHYISSPIRVVDPSKTTTFTDEYVPRVSRKYQIALKLTDSKTGAPAARFEPHVRYFEHPLAPSRWSSTQYYNMDKIDGGWQYGTALCTGRTKMVIYGVWCYLPNGDRAVLPRYVHKLDVPAPTSEDAEPLKLLLDLTTPEMSEAEAAKLWPWEVYGTVKDRAGQPLAGVRVHAHCGVGSAEVAETHSAADGSYRLRLAASPYYSSDRIAKATVWKAWIQAAAPGMAEVTLSRQGDIGLIEDGDEPEPGSFRHHHLRSGYFVKRNEPFGPIDFVMTPEVELEVELIDTERRPIEGRHVSFRVDAATIAARTYKNVEWRLPHSIKFRPGKLAGSPCEYHGGSPYYNRPAKDEVHQRRHDTESSVQAVALKNEGPRAITISPFARLPMPMARMCWNRSWWTKTERNESHRKERVTGNLGSFFAIRKFSGHIDRRRFPEKVWTA